MSATLTPAEYYQSHKWVVTLYDGRIRVGRVIFREMELPLAEQCQLDALTLDTSDAGAVLAFVSAWHERRSFADELPKGGRPQRQRKPWRSWHVETP